MTGYGHAKGQVGGLQVAVELRSLNSKFLELNMRLPMQFRDRELELRAEIGKLLERGKADMLVTIENNELARRSAVNREIFAAYHGDLSALAREYKLNEDGLLDILLRMPAVMNAEKAETDEDSFKELKHLVLQALERFNNFRDDEGLVLQKDLTDRIHAIMAAVPRVESHEAGRMESVRQRLEKSLSELADQSAVDRNRFEQELIYYLEKLDISEEKVRLRSHCDYFLQALEGSEANGKKLGFIAQEIGREINTIGSKANDAGMQRIVVEMKDELEKIKEQLANVL